MRRLLTTLCLAASSALVCPALLPVPSAAAPGRAAAATSGGSLCSPVTPTSRPRPARRLRFGIDSGMAGNPLPTPSAAKPVDSAKELAALGGLRPRHRVLVVRLNRLFWSGGSALLHEFAKRERHYSSRGFDVEVQVRYHPTSSENGDIAAWTRYVRHAVDVLGRDRRLVSLTITNEVNFAVSPNTSDGAYDDADAALVRGVEAAHAELHRHGWAKRVSVGFTFAYRLNPRTDAALFQYLRTAGGRKFRRALGFVGLDDYPGTVYPPVLSPGDSAGDELATAIATMRECYLPMAGIGRHTPLWVTENGFPSNAPAHTEADQATQLRSLVGAARRYGGSYHVSDYRWFNLRDNDSHGSGMFDQDGLLRDDYSPKPAYAALRHLIRSTR